MRGEHPHTRPVYTSVRFPTIPCASQVVPHIGDTRSRTTPPCAHVHLLATVQLGTLVGAFELGRHLVVYHPSVSPLLRGLKDPPARARERGGGSARIRPPRVNQPWRADLLIIPASVAAFGRVERSTFPEGGCLCLVRQDPRKRRTGDFTALAARQVPSAWGRGTGNLAAIRRRSRSAGRDPTRD